MKQKKWYKLDNVGKIFPPITNDYDPCVFRISCTLNDKIDKDVLNESLKKTLVDFPFFNSVLRRGFFWYYIEEVSFINNVVEESKDPCERLYGILYRVTYYDKRINLEVSHALTDGYGASTFLKCLVANYLKLKYKVKCNEEIDKASTFEKTEDAFKKYYKKLKLHKSNISKKAYKIKGKVYDDYRVKFIEATCSSSKIMNLAKQNDASVSQYLTSVLIQAILKQMTEREKRRPVFITIPASLRKDFSTFTTRNFFCTMSVYYKSNGKDDFTDILKSVKEQFEEELKKESLYSKMSEMIFLESFFICRIVPRIIKDVVLRYSYKLTRKAHTMSFSNLGKISMPKEYEEFIDGFSFDGSTDGIELKTISFNDKMKFSFCSHFLNTEIQKNFIRYFSDLGIDFYIDTNIIENEL